MTIAIRLLLLSLIVCAVSAADASHQVLHIVLLKWKDEVTPAQEADVGAKLLALKDKIPGVIAMSFGHQNSPEAATKGHGFTAALTVTFANAAARDAYLPNPDHQAVVTVLKTMLADLAVVDYDL
jgi:hypothetical protein